MCNNVELHLFEEELRKYEQEKGIPDVPFLIQFLENRNIVDEPLVFKLISSLIDRFPDNSANQQEVIKDCKNEFPKFREEISRKVKELKVSSSIVDNSLSKIAIPRNFSGSTNYQGEIIEGERLEVELIEEVDDKGASSTVWKGKVVKVILFNRCRRSCCG